MVTKADLLATVERIRSAQHVLVLTGAGMSAESGIPTFRGTDGLWKNHRPEELASPEAFAKDPELVLEWYGIRRNKIHEAQPNPGHHALVELATRVPQFTLVTQNVDNLHGRAGSRDVLELHGNIDRGRCLSCEAVHDLSGVDRMDACPNCQGKIRPDIVWFGEMLPEGLFERAAGLASQCDVCLSIGTSAVVYPAASLPLLAKEGGALCVEINVEPSAIIKEMDLLLQGPSGEVLPSILEELGDA